MRLNLELGVGSGTSSREDRNFEDDIGHENDFTNEDIKSGFKKLTKKFNFLLRKAAGKNYKKLILGDYIILTGGVTEEYWSQADLDLEVFRVDNNASSRVQGNVGQTRLGKLNSEVLELGSPMASYASLSKMDAYIHSFHSSSTKVTADKERTYYVPKVFILEYVLSKGSSSGKDYKIKSLRSIREYLILYLIKFIVLHCIHMDLYEHEYQSYRQKAEEIRREVLSVHLSIDNLLEDSALSKKKKNASKKNKDSSKGKKGMGYLDEVKLLHKASINFTRLMELDEKLADSITLLKDKNSSIEKMERDIKLKNIISHSQLSHMDPLHSHLKGIRKSVLFSFEILREHVVNSQERLRNSIDSFQRYQDDRRRATSEKSEKWYNLVFVMLAVLALGDAIGNFLVYYRESGDLEGTVKGLSSVIIILAFFFMLVYMLVLRKLFSTR